ncbi:unnamed protein product, partial [Adineta steineri]
YYKEKCEELNKVTYKILDRQREEIDKIRFQINELLDKQETTYDDINSLTLSIDRLKQNLNEIDQLSINVNISPYKINKELISFNQSYLQEFNLLSILSSYSTMTRLNKSSIALVSNDQNLLIHQNSNLCLIDDELTIIKQKEWIYDSIIHMCWSSILNSFIIITAIDILLVYEH